ncbi:MAG: PaaI family thioesterase, partial [Vicingaceae bacterium]|mgnify:CR=1 FL=1
MKLTIIEPGKISYEMKVLPKHLATPTAIHGGMLAAMMDAVMGVASLSAVALDNKLVSTVEFKISYLNPALLGDLLTGNGIVDKKGNRIIYASGEILNQENKIIAKAMGTFNAYPIEKSDLKEYI